MWCITTTGDVMSNFEMEPWEKELLKRTKEFVAEVCPDLEDDRRILVAAKIYDRMRRTLLVVGHD
jgi:hypothetical protein